MARFLALCVGATAVLAAVALGNGDRVDIIVYGRYVEVFAAPVLLLGGLAAADRLRRIRLVRFIGGGTVAVAVTAACVIGYWGVRVAGAPQRTNTFAVDHVFRLTGGEFQAGIFAAIALGALVVVVGAYRLGAAIGMVVVIATFVPATAYGYSEVVDQSTGALLNRTLPDALLATQERFHGPGCVGWDRSMDSAAVSWLFFNTRLFDPGRTFEVFDSAGGGVPCSPLVVASSRFSSLEAYRGARMVVPTAGPAVWVLPGALQARLDRAGWLLPAGWPAALPDAARHGSLRLLDAAGRAVPTVDLLTGTGHSVSVRIQVNHADQGPAWPAAAAIGTVPRYAVRLGISWYPAGHDGQPAVATARADLPVSLLPGRSATLTAPLGSVDLHGAPIPTGRYDVEISVIQEGVADFAATIPPVWVHVRVLSR